MILCTSNLEEAIDEAFLDRADLKLYVGNPGPRARYDILSSCIQELGRVGLITDATRLAATAHAPPAGAGAAGASAEGAAVARAQADAELMAVCELAHDRSGRQLRKVPFMAFAMHIKQGPRSLSTFLQALRSYLTDAGASSQAIKPEVRGSQSMQE